MTPRQTCMLVAGMLINTPLYATDARTDAMGGAAVASGDYLSAPLHNPALLGEFDDADDVGLLLPALTLEASDPDNLEQHLDEFQQAYDALLDSQTLAEFQQHRSQMLESLAQLDSKPVQSAIGAALVIAIPNQYLPLAVFAKATAEFHGTVNVAQSDLDDPPLDIDKLQSEAIMAGAATVDYGITLAQNYPQVIDSKSTLSFGYSAKIQQLYLYHYRENPALADFDDARDRRYRNQVSDFNLDIGLLNRWSHWRLGLVGTNLIKQQAQTVELNTIHFEYEVRPQYSAAVAYVSELFTLAVDGDLNQHKGFTHLPCSQFVRIGTELNGWDWAQLRAGFRHDLKQVKPDLVTAGIGLSPFGALHLDLAAGYGGKREYSAGLQLSFTL